MSKTLTQSEYDAGVERFKKACILVFNLKYAWPPAPEALAQAQAEYDAAFAAISDGPKGDWGINVVPDEEMKTL